MGISRDDALRIARAAGRAGADVAELREFPVGWLVTPRTGGELVIGLGCLVVTHEGELYDVPSSVPWDVAPHEVAVLLGLEGSLRERLAARIRAWTGNGGPQRIIGRR